MREIADARVHGTIGEAPLLRFERDEAAALQPLKGRRPFRQVRELVRRGQADCAIQIDGNSYSVPWRLVGESLRATVPEGRVRIHHRGEEVAMHPEVVGRWHCRGHRPNTSAPLVEAGHEHRPCRLVGRVDPPKADGDPRPTRQSAR